MGFGKGQDVQVELGNLSSNKTIYREVKRLVRSLNLLAGWLGNLWRTTGLDPIILFPSRPNCTNTAVT